jgi:hypothetical protein
MLANGRHPAGDFVQLQHDRHQFADAKVELLDQADDFVPPGNEPAPGLSLFGRVAAPAQGLAIVDLVEPKQVLDRGQVGRDSLECPLLFGGVRDRDFDRPVEPQLAVLNLFQKIDRALQHEVVCQQRAAEVGPRAFDALGRGDFPLAVEHRDLAHLHQVHADRVVDVRFAAAAHRLEIDFDVGFVVVRHFVRVDQFDVIAEDDGVIDVVAVDAGRIFKIGVGRGRPLARLRGAAGARSVLARSVFASDGGFAGAIGRGASHRRFLTMCQGRSIRVRWPRANALPVPTGAAQEPARVVSAVVKRVSAVWQTQDAMLPNRRRDADSHQRAKNTWRHRNMPASSHHIESATIDATVILSPVPRPLISSSCTWQVAS